MATGISTVLDDSEVLRVGVAPPPSVLSYISSPQNNKVLVVPGPTHAISTVGNPSVHPIHISPGLNRGTVILQGAPVIQVEVRAKTVETLNGRVSSVLSYLDSGKTQLVERRDMTYTDGVLTSVSFFDEYGSATKTRTLLYTGGVLTGYTDV